MTGARLPGLLLGLAAISFWSASAIHFGWTPALGGLRVSDPFAGAAPPEAIIGLVSAAGSAWMLATRRPRPAPALGSALIALGVTAYGLSVTLRGGRAGDVAYHLSVLAVLVAATALILLVRRRRPAAGRS